MKVKRGFMRTPFLCICEPFFVAAKVRIRIAQWLRTGDSILCPLDLMSSFCLVVSGSQDGNLVSGLQLTIHVQESPHSPNSVIEATAVDKTRKNLCWQVTG